MFSIIFLSFFEFQALKVGKSPRKFALRARFSALRALPMRYALAIFCILKKIEF